MLLGAEITSKSTYLQSKRGYSALRATLMLFCLRGLKFSRPKGTLRNGKEMGFWGLLVEI